tara:strand:- start:2467 stop:2757 length:291 start_codon:yes stop_codon:yes gene_type:complete
MSYGHGSCGMNNPNCGRGVKGCASMNDPDEQDFDNEMHKNLVNYLEYELDNRTSILCDIADTVAAIEDDAGDYKDWLVDNELYEALQRVIELSEEG